MRILSLKNSYFSEKYCYWHVRKEKYNQNLQKPGNRFQDTLLDKLMIDFKTLCLIS